MESPHRARLAPYVSPHLERRATGEKHPVHDFMFTYYSYRPAQLLQWHPGYPDGVSPAFVSERIPLIRQLLTVLRATAARPASFGCFGMHEWAMVYRSADPRHASWPLRLGAAGTDAVVESHKVACSHFDAYRFFTPEARPLNTLSPGPGDRPEFEQPGCLHANMDLYKHAFRLSPMVCSDLVADCFELAWEIREVDMRASPYDLSSLGYPPIAVETPEGKAEYAAHQRAFAERAAPLRQRLIEECERLLAVAPQQLTQ